jgi:hypothetical protein
VGVDGFAIVSGDRQIVSGGRQIVSNVAIDKYDSVL